MSDKTIQENNSPTIDYRLVEFPSLDTNLIGKFYLPDGITGALPALVMTHGFSATIDGMVGENYAEVFCQAGFAVLLYDHYSFGRSGGEPRCQINKWVQARGYYDAISYLADLPEIDSERIGIWGDSMSADVAIVLASIDRRVKAVLAQVPACGSRFSSEDPDGRLFQLIAETILRDDLLSMPATATEMMPVVSFDQIGTPSHLLPLTAFKWFIEYGAMFGTNWVNQASRVSLNLDLHFDSGVCAPHLKVPLQMLIAHDDEMPGADAGIAYQVYEAARCPKEYVDLDGGHFGLVYFPGEIFDYASQKQREFLLRYL